MKEFQHVPSFNFTSVFGYKYKRRFVFRVFMNTRPGKQRDE